MTKEPINLSKPKEVEMYSFLGKQNAPMLVLLIFLWKKCRLPMWRPIEEYILVFVKHTGQKPDGLCSRPW